MLARWKELMDGEFVDDVDEYHSVDEWGHTVDHVDGPFKLSGEAWDMLLPTAIAAVNEALQLERDLRGRFDLAAVANLASELRVSAELLHRTLIEACRSGPTASAGRCVCCRLSRSRPVSAGPA